MDIDITIIYRHRCRHRHRHRHRHRYRYRHRHIYIYIYIDRDIDIDINIDIDIDIFIDIDIDIEITIYRYIARHLSSCRLASPWRSRCSKRSRSKSHRLPPRLATPGGLIGMPPGEEWAPTVVAGVHPHMELLASEGAAADPTTEETLAYKI